MMSLFFAIALAVIGFAAIILEIFVPAAGLIGILGSGCVIGGIVITFINYGTGPGTIFLFSVLITGPIVIMFFFRLFPVSFVGRRLILGTRQSREDGYTAQHIDNEEDLIHQHGRTISPLRPAGRVLIGGHRYSAVSRGEFIDNEKEIEVIKIEGNHLTVKELSHQKGA